MAKVRQHELSFFMLMNVAQGMGMGELVDCLLCSCCIVCESSDACVCYVLVSLVMHVSVVVVLRVIVPVVVP